MTDETTPGETLGSDAPVEPEAPAPSAEPELPPDATQVLAASVAEAPVPTPAAAPQPVVVEAPAPMVPSAAGLGPSIPSGSRVIVMVSRGPAPAPSSAFVSVPEVVGMAQGDALARLQQASLPTQVFNDYHPKLPRGQVMAQLPSPGATVPAGSESVLMVSSGPSPVPSIPTSLPNVVGMSESDAVSSVQAAGLSPQLVREYSTMFPDGVAIGQIPNPTSLISIPKRRSLAWLWVVLALLVLVALGVGGYLYINRTGIVPVVVGLSQADAIAAIEAAGFDVGSIDSTQTLKAADVGKVVVQSPAANTESRMIDGINIVVSGGQKLLDVPAVTGKTQTDAEQALKDAGLKSTVSQAFSSTVVKGVVISQAPEAGQKVPSETSVGIVISQGVQNITVPNVTDQTENQAILTLKALNLGTPKFVSIRSTVYKEGRVAGQFPLAGESLPPGTVMGLVLSAGSSEETPTVKVPRLLDQTSTAAETSLKNLSLKMVTIQWSGTGRPLNQVVGQIPAENNLLFKNESVIVIVSNGR